MSVTGEWTHLRLAGDHERTRMYNSIDNRLAGTADDGEILTVRTTLLTEVTDA